MKITIYNAKGGAGKSPLAANIALDRGYAVATNEGFPVHHKIIPENRLMQVSINTPFPQIPDSIDCVFDLAGSMSETAYSVTSALEQSDWVIVPIYSTPRSIEGGLYTIREVSRFNKNIIVVATKLVKKKAETWEACKDFIEISQRIITEVGSHIPIFPLKESQVFENIFAESKSIAQLVEEGGLAKHHYEEVARQFDAIYHLIDNQHGK